MQHIALLSHCNDDFFVSQCFLFPKNPFCRWMSNEDEFTIICLMKVSLPDESSVKLNWEQKTSSGQVILTEKVGRGRPGGWKIAMIVVRFMGLSNKQNHSPDLISIKVVIANRLLLNFLWK